jgi:two-component system, NarL family, sensor histidine kinase DesK
VGAVTDSAGAGCEQAGTVGRQIGHCQQPDDLDTVPLGRADDPFDAGRSGWRNVVLPVVLAGVWLVYLVQPLEEILTRPSGVWRTTGAVAIAAFSAAYITVFFQMRRRRWVTSAGSVYEPYRLDRVNGALLAVMVMCFAAMIPSAGGASMAAVVYVVATVMMIVPLRLGWAVSLAAVAGTEAAASLVPGWQSDRGAGLAILLASVAVFGIRMALRRSQELMVARDDLARLAVQEERNRFARDLHDILGHSLTLVTMKAELAGRLVHVDPDAAEREIADVERLTREALADVRAAVSGYRGVTLAGELANARAALQAAGIAADLPSAVDDVPGERRALFGWAVREGVTNVVRHSGASRCTVSVSADAVEIRDDGRGRPTGPSPGEARLHVGHGLVGLGERARAVGGRVRTRSDTKGFSLRVEIVPPPTTATSEMTGVDPAGMDTRDARR